MGVNLTGRVSLMGLAGRVRDAARIASHTHRITTAPFRRGETYIPPSGKVIGETEFQYAMSAVTEGWFTEGPWTDLFEGGLEVFFRVRHACFVNSGSSALMLAIEALLDPLANEQDRFGLARGDHVITAAVGFPTTVNPLLRLGLTPVLVDVEPGTYVPSLSAILQAAEDYGAKAVVMAHTLGAPWPVQALREARPAIRVVEDNCDAFGSKDGSRLTGAIGDLATLSFYPAHHITTGEGGAVLTNSGRLARVVESLRDWGRACYCPPGHENTCGKRFGWDFSPLPPGTDHKYVYERIGYNLKATDMQAALGVAQLESVVVFITRRIVNWNILRGLLAPYEDVFVLPHAPPNTEPSWFGFCLALRPGPFSREDLCRFLESRRIGTRPLFAGFLPDQPAYRGPMPMMAMAGDLANAREAGRSAFWVGVWPGLGTDEMEWIAECLQEAGECARKGQPLPTGAA